MRGLSPARHLSWLTGLVVFAPLSAWQLQRQWWQQTVVMVRDLRVSGLLLESLRPCQTQLWSTYIYNIYVDLQNTDNKISVHLPWNHTAGLTNLWDPTCTGSKPSNKWFSVVVLQRFQSLRCAFIQILKLPVVWVKNSKGCLHLPNCYQLNISRILKRTCDRTCRAKLWARKK